MDNNRYEEIEKKDNPLVKILKMFGQYLKNLGYDFVVSFKYNNMKLASILVALPGVLLGFFLKWHSVVVRNLAFSQGTIDGVEHFYKISFDYSGMVLFLLMLFGILNVFTAFSMSKKKNLGSVVLSTVCTVGIVACSVLYLYIVFTFIEGYNAYQSAYQESFNSFIASGLSEVEAAQQASSACTGIGISTTEAINFDYNYYISIISIILAMVSSVVGCVLGFINYDRTYEKVDR